MSFRANGMNRPGFASRAPAPKIATRRRSCHAAHLVDHGRLLLQVHGPAKETYDEDEQQDPADDVDDCDPGLRGRLAVGGRGVSEYEGGGDTDCQCRDESSEVEPETGE